MTTGRPFDKVSPDWKHVRLKSVLYESDKRSVDGRETLLSVTEHNGVVRRESIIGEGDHLTRAESLVGYKIAERGDLVVNIMLAWKRGLGVAWERGIVSPAYAVFRRRVTDVSCRYLDYLTRSDPAVTLVASYSYGIVDSRLRIYPQTLLALELPFPPPDVQQAIATFLDRQTARIDALVEKKTRLIELLEEKRTALVTQAVTKGLDRDASMKDSGVEWVGDIPRHWEVVRTKFVAKLESGHTPSRSNPEYWEHCTIPWFTLADVYQLRDGRVEYVRETKEQVSELGLANSSARLLPEGTVMLSRTASVGFSAVMACPMATTQDFVNWICGVRICPTYLLYVFRAMKEEFRRLIQGSTHQTIYMPDVERFATPLPTVDEQREIVQHVRDSLERLDQLQDEVGKAISLLTEYRTALISAAVTGQIDVREHPDAAA